MLILCVAHFLSARLFQLSSCESSLQLFSLFLLFVSHAL
jgi:hypothetical protein